MMKSILAFEEVGQVVLADSSWIKPRNSRFLRPGSKYDGPNIFSRYLHSKNMMEESIMPFEHFWVSSATKPAGGTHAPAPLPAMATQSPPKPCLLP
jgi:hypothetical protein